MYDPLQYVPSPHDACQKPSHRWLRCLYLLEDRRPPTLDDDGLTHQAYACLRDWQRCQNDAQREQLACAQPALAEAHRFYQTASLLQRAEVEARLLASRATKALLAGRFVIGSRPPLYMTCISMCGRTCKRTFISSLKPSARRSMLA
jgi:hypothetical protein